MLLLTGDVVADRAPNVSSVRNDTVHDKLRKWKKNNNNQLRHQNNSSPTNYSHNLCLTVSY